ncbi:MAG: type II toxin-antitoxin system RelE/ParE family toxin [Tyzzerella sp.]|nr:type II toxin-antitoxin system RelE/ParE family toxin [Tyzzerella sp.]
MELVYKESKVEKQCTSLKEARKLFGGNDSLARSLLSRINSLKNAEVIKDIILMPPFHFHKLEGDKEGYFAIDVKSRRDPWRIILQPLNENKEPYEPCNIDEIAGTVQIVGIMEVSKHYE